MNKKKRVKSADNILSFFGWTEYSMLYAFFKSFKLKDSALLHILFGTNLAICKGMKLNENIVITF